MTYISREAAKEEACERCAGQCYCNKPEFCSWMAAIDAIPAADVREVKRGRWEDEWAEAADPHDRRCFRCSSCRTIHAERTNYCPNCGASMENGKKTNYEKIVSMSIENLADLLSNSSCSECPLRYKCGGREEVDVAMCYKYWLRYLKSEVAHGN